MQTEQTELEIDGIKYIVSASFPPNSDDLDTDIISNLYRHFVGQYIAQQRKINESWKRERKNKFLTFLKHPIWSLFHLSFFF